ncbi:MAG TPA: 3',5'-cyclic-nucleotide phosphodiesterase [Puia sp.]|nr:3',5'-cyclic-nucleotide phosphodiesterase [Puia sp.]
MKVLVYFLLATLFSNLLFGQTTGPEFTVIPLGVLGGGDESNLSSYMVAAGVSDNFVCLDAGTIRFGIRRAIEMGTFRTSESSVMRENIKGYLISHPHLDHVAGLIINSPDDTDKAIYGLPFCIDILKEKYFTWKSWANFADQGDSPALAKYHYVLLDSSLETKIVGTDLYVRPFLLSHASPNLSTAFLIRNNNSYLLYLGDTGADSLENSSRIMSLWKAVSPIVKLHALKAIFVESSFSDEQPLNRLFGHLTPSLLMNELNQLAAFTGKNSLHNLPVVVTHIKPSEKDAVNKIKNELASKNSLELKLVFPEQGIKIEF